MISERAPNALGVWQGAEGKAMPRDNFEMMQIGLHGRGAALDAALKVERPAGVFIIPDLRMIWPEACRTSGAQRRDGALRGSC